MAALENEETTDGPIRISLRCGKTPTPTFPFSSPPNPNTPCCNNLALRSGSDESVLLPDKSGGLNGSMQHHLI